MAALDCPVVEDLIYDVGMHAGDDAAYYLHRGYRVVGVEANPDLCEQATRRFAAEVGNGRLTILNFAIADKAGTEEFWVCDGNPVWSSCLESAAAKDGLPVRRIRTPCRPLHWVLDRFGTPFYLKIDIEGRDLLALKDLVRRPAVPAYVSAEISSIEEFVDVLTASGYSEFKLMSQFNFLPLQRPPSWAQRLFEARRWVRSSQHPTSRAGRWLLQHWLRRSPREECESSRRLGNWVFPWESSGPFGEDTPGRWLGRSEVQRVYRHYRDLKERGGSSPFWNEKGYSFWVDLHARHPTAALRTKRLMFQGIGPMKGETPGRSQADEMAPT